MPAESKTVGNRSLFDAVERLRGVGPERAALLERLGLRTACDLLFFFPRDYQDMTELREVSQLEENVPAAVTGIVEEVELRGAGVGRTMLGVLVRQGAQHLRALWFNQPYMRDKFAVGQRVLLTGAARCRGLRWEMAHPRVKWLADDEGPAKGQVLPVYPLTDGIHQALMQRVVRTAVDQYADLVEEVFPETFLADHSLASIHTALRDIHAPENSARVEIARHRFVYQELLVMQLALATRRWKLRHERRAQPLPLDPRIDARITRLFPFELTADQRQAISDLTTDMAREHPMNRLLQGDVGSGKTVVAEYAMLLAVAHRCQAVLMAPTEILARQHFNTLTRDLRQSRVRIALLTGALAAAERSATLAAIAAGEVDLVVGTHAVLQEDIEFARLALVVIDEQHRFGVRQRATLRSAAVDPHYLVMTATPIPRTISMTLFGDLDTSTLRQSPPGRQPVHTYLAEPEKRAQWWDFFRRKLREGRQGYVIAPLVDDESPNAPASVEKVYEQLTNGELDAFCLDLIHGRLSSHEKESAMDAFRSGKTQVLVATSVVEVGVDVPNATLMTIENAERFGLAQLHQLRGRICRGVFPGYLCVFAEPSTQEAHQRLEAFSKVNDGFELAELDFQLRGPGDLFGLQQHGLPPLRIADLKRDAEIVQQTRNDAQAIIEADPHLERPGWDRLKNMVLRRYGAALELSDVG